MDHRGNETEAGCTDHSEIATPSSPAAGSLRIYAKSDGNVYKKTSAGVESQIGSGGAAVMRRVFSNPGASGQYITCASNAAFDIASPSKFTIRMWWRGSVTINNHGLATRSSLGSSQGDWAFGFLAEGR
jgi:hypothetical protein